MQAAVGKPLDLSLRIHQSAAGRLEETDQGPVCSRIAAKIRHDEPDLRSFAPAGGKEIAETRVRYGYRRIHVLLRREGWPVNAKRVYRLYQELGLQLRNKTPNRKVKAKLREGRADAERRNDVWAMDFVHDQLYDGTRIRALTIIDTFTRYVPAIDVRRSYTGRTSSTRLSVSVPSLAIRSPSGSTKGRSSSRKILISGPTSKASNSTSHAPANRRTMPSSRA